MGEESVLKTPAVETRQEFDSLSLRLEGGRDGNGTVTELTAN